MKVSKSSTKNKKGFTLAEDATHVAMQDNSRKVAFTLAEVLITLGIIGVVAAITMPMLITNVRNHVRAKRIENIEQKFSKATDKMVALGVYNGHGSTAEFVNELGKHLKLAKVCDNSNLASCWPYSEVQLSDGKMWKIADTKKAKNMKMEDTEGAVWDDTMGIITADGTSMILSYNKNCGIDDTQRITWSGSVSSTTGCVAVKYDWNGATKPNKDNDDVLAINAGAFGNSCLFEVGGTCYSKVIKAVQPMTYAECEAEKGNLGITECCPDSFCNGDYWASAVKACGGINNLLTKEKAAKLANEMYLSNNGGKPNLRSSDGWVEDLVLLPNSNIAGTIGLTTKGFVELWISDDYDNMGANFVIFANDYVGFDESTDREGAFPQILCVGN